MRKDFKQKINVRKSEYLYQKVTLRNFGIILHSVKKLLMLAFTESFTKIGQWMNARENLVKIPEPMNYKVHIFFEDIIELAFLITISWPYDCDKHHSLLTILLHFTSRYSNYNWISVKSFANTSRNIT